MKRISLSPSVKLILPNIKQLTSPNDEPFNFNRINYLRLSSAYLSENDYQLPMSNFKLRMASIMKEYKYELVDEDEKKSDISNLLPSSRRYSYKKNKEKIKKIVSRTNRLMKSSSCPIVFNTMTGGNRTINANENIGTSVKKQELPSIMTGTAVAPLGVPYQTDSSDIQFNIKQESFKSPIHSYNTVQRNRIIYENLMENYENREYNQYKTTYNQINQFVNQTKQTHQIKIIQRIPKAINSLPTNKKGKNENDMKKKSTSLAPTDRKTTLLQLMTRFVYGQKTFPESREQFAFCQEGNEIILHGGLVYNKNAFIWRLNPINFNWTKLTPKNAIVVPRYGHTGVLYHRKLIIFGGRYYDIPVFGDVDVFHLDTLTWNTPTLFTTIKAIRLRRNHIACVVGNQMFIHGGIDNDEEYLNDSYLLNLSPIKWMPCQINSITNSPTLGFHSCCLVLQEEYRIHSKLSIYRLPDLGDKLSLNFQLREKGIYVFGGKSSEESVPSNAMWVLRIGKSPLEWIQLKTKGQGPSLRFSSSMNYYEEGNCVIIHGGHNDNLSDDFALNDTYFLDLYHFTWVRVIHFFETPEIHKVVNRCAHASVIHGNNMIIFGGMNSESYLKSSLFVIELDSKVKVQLKLNESAIDKMLNKFTRKKVY